MAFLFSGQGGQHAGMAARLYEAEPTFRGGVQEFAGILKGHLGSDLLELLFGRSAERDGGPIAATAASRPSLVPTALAQPALFAVEYSLARM